VFLGSCMTNIGHFRAAGKLWPARSPIRRRARTSAATRMDQAKLKGEAYFSALQRHWRPDRDPRVFPVHGESAAGSRRHDRFSTSTRNFDNRMGNGAKVFLDRPNWARWPR